MSPPLLSLRGVSKEFRHESRRIRAAADVSFDVAEGECLAVVGESGSGKSTVANLILGVYPPDAGEIRFRGEPLPVRRRLPHRRLIQLVQQNPLSSLNPRRTVGASLRLALDVHRIGAPRERPEAVRALLAEVGLPGGFARRYPAALSGGERQRVAIARALACRSELVVLDEPTSSARRARPGAGIEAARRSPAAARAHLRLHHPRSFGGAQRRRPGRGVRARPADRNGCGGDPSSRRPKPPARGASSARCPWLPRKKRGCGRGSPGSAAPTTAPLPPHPGEVPDERPHPHPSPRRRCRSPLAAREPAVPPPLHRSAHHVRDRNAGRREGARYAGADRVRPAPGAAPRRPRPSHDRA